MAQGTNVISVIVPAVWLQGGRMSQQFHWCGQVPTTTPGTVPFQMTTTGVGPVDLGKSWTGLLEWTTFPAREPKKWFTHSFNHSLQIQENILEKRREC